MSRAGKVERLGQPGDAGFNPFGLDGVESQAEIVFRRMAVEKMGLTRFDQYPGVGGPPRQLLRIDRLRGAYPESVGGALPGMREHSGRWAFSASLRIFQRLAESAR